jgi:diguanylate cyclase (GGDEF)-like protein/PAS domain S-box-containing protein
MNPDQQDLLANALSSIANAVFITDRYGRIVWANEAFGRLSGYAVHEALGRSPAMLKSGRQNADFYRELWQTILAGSVWRGKVVERRKDGSLYTVDETITPLCDAAGNIAHFVATLHDLTSRKKESDRDHFLAYHDSLTGLPNRALFLRLLEQALAHCARSACRLAVLYIDLDHFKPVNDTLGHQLGDLLLVTVAKRLRASVRKSDVVARLAGDEFTVIQTDLVDTRPARALARTLVHALRRPFMLKGREVRVSASVGISIYPDHGASAEELLQRADLAMYRAKEQGRNRYRFYEAQESGGPPAKPRRCARSG